MNFARTYFWAENKDRLYTKESGCNFTMNEQLLVNLLWRSLSAIFLVAENHSKSSAHQGMSACLILRVIVVTSIFCQATLSILLNYCTILLRALVTALLKKMVGHNSLCVYFSSSLRIAWFSLLSNKSTHENFEQWKPDIIYWIGVNAYGNSCNTMVVKDN